MNSEKFPAVKKVFPTLFAMKKGETQSHIIMWVGILIALAIIVLWSMQNLNPRHLDLETVNIDLEELQSHFNAGCNSHYYKAKWNPRTINGFLILNGSNICIENSFDKCRLSLCDTELNLTIDFRNITYVVIEHNRTEGFSITTE